MIVPRRYWRNPDCNFILAVLAHCHRYGGIHSASYSQLTSAGLSPFYVTRQVMGLALGLAANIVIISIDYQKLRSAGPNLLALSGCWLGFLPSEPQCSVAPLVPHRLEYSAVRTSWALVILKHLKTRRMS